MNPLLIPARLLSGICRGPATTRLVSSVQTSPTRVTQEEDIRALNDFFPVIADAVKKAVEPYGIPSQTEWLGRMLQYNADRVRWTNSVMTLNAMRELSAIKSHGELAPEVMIKAKYLAWCHELLCASYGIADDLLDGGEMRWDKPSWYTLPGVGLAAICDSGLLENVVFQVLRQQFKGSPYYGDLVDLFMDTALHAYLGQNDDIHIARSGRAMLDDFTLARYNTAATLKTSALAFYGPVAAAMLVSGVQDRRAYAVAYDISIDLSVIFQMQDDYVDCFGDTKDDVSTDIRNGSCTWMILEAKKIANEKQKKILKENYGHDDRSKADAVKEVFQELGLKERLLDYRRTLFKLIEKKINRNSQIIPPNVYRYAVETLQENVVVCCHRTKV